MAKLTYTGAEVQALLDKLNELAGHKGILLVDGEQVVTGIKNFINGLQIGGKLVKYDATTNAFIFPANAVFEGGIAWNTKLEGFEEQTVTAAVQVDWKTIGKNENGELYVIGGTSGGGGVVGGVTLDEVKNYLLAEKYATQGWVTDQGYLKSISASMVTSALGYTPFDSANFTKSKLKSTLGISDWALEGVKPSYKFSEITNKPTTLNGYGITDAYTKTQVDSALGKKWTQDNALISNWNAAYEWGNHANAGYAKQSDIAGYVTLSTDQTITGIKDFSNGLKVGGKLVTYNASKNAFIFPANAIFEGGVAWNSKLEGFDVPTIMDAVIVDGETIIKENGKLKVIGDLSGGIDEAELGNYLTRNNYAKKSDIPSLSGYATESFVTTRGYITASAIPTKVSAFTNDASYATESFVTSRGYITSASISKANIKSTLGISDWALAATSPLVNHGKITSATDLTALTTGLGYTQGFTPVDGAYNYGQLLNFATYRGLTQIYITDGYSSTGRTIHFRNDWNKTGIESRTWYEILSSNTYTKYAMSLMTEQDVTGIKNFVNGFKVGGKLVSYNSDENAFILPANLLVEGGIAWNTKLDGFDQQTVTAAVSVDGTTINRTTSGALQLNPAIEARIAALEVRVEQLHPTA